MTLRTKYLIRAAIVAVSLAAAVAARAGVAVNDLSNAPVVVGTDKLLVSTNAAAGSTNEHTRTASISNVVASGLSAVVGGSTSNAFTVVGTGNTATLNLAGQAGLGGTTVSLQSSPAGLAINSTVSAGSITSSGTISGNHSGDGSALTSLNGSQVTSGTIAAARGGAGTVNGLLKANGAGTVSAASAGSDYLAPGNVGNAAFSNSFVRLMSPQAGNIAIADMESAGAPDFIGQLGLSWSGGKEMAVWTAGAASAGSNGWDVAGYNFLPGVHQIGDATRMPANSTPGVYIYMNGNANYSRRIWATTNSGPRNGSYLWINNLNPFTDGNGIAIPMYATNGSGTPMVTNSDGGIVRQWDQFGLVIASLSGNYVVGETNFAGSYDIITGVGNSIPLYICCNAQIGAEPSLGQKAWVAFDNRGLANSANPCGTHFQAWIPGVYAFTNAGNKDVLFIQQQDATGGGMRVEVLTNLYVKSGNLWATNVGGINAFATGARIDLTKGVGLECNTNVAFHWSSTDQSKGATWSFDDYTHYRFAIMQKFGQFPKIVHGSGAPFAIARSDNADLQTDQSAQTLTDEFSIDASGNATASGNLSVAGTTYFAGVTTHSNNVTVDAAHTLTANSTTQTAGDNSTKLATTAYVDQEGGWVISQVTGSDATTTGQSLVNVTGLSFAAAANTTYEIEGVLYVTTSAVTTGTQYGIAYSGSGSPTCKVLFSGALTTSTAATTYVDATNTPTATAFLTTSAQTGVIIAKGIVVSGSGAGNITLTHLKNTSGTSTVKIGSVMKVRKLI